MIEVLAKDGVFDFPPPPEFFWMGLEHSALTVALAMAVALGPFVGGLLGWGYSHTPLLAWPVGFLVLVSGTLGALDFPAPDALAPWILDTVLVLLCGFWLLGVTGTSYPLGRLCRIVGARRFGWRKAPFDSPHVWSFRSAAFSIFVGVGFALFIILLVTHGEASRSARLYRTELAYANMLESTYAEEPIGFLSKLNREKPLVVMDGNVITDELLSHPEIDYHVVHDGRGYWMEFEGSPRRIRGVAGKVWIEETEDLVPP